MTFLIVPTHNEQARLEKFIACLNRQTVKPFVLFVDNGTRDCQNCVVTQYTGHYRCLPITSKSYSQNFWTGCLKRAQDWIANPYCCDEADIVGIMNTDVTFGPKYIEFADQLTDPFCLVSSVIVDAATGKAVQKGVRLLWNEIFTRQYGAISAVSVFRPPIDAFRDSGIFMTVENFRKIKFHPYLLPHYHGDYAWTNKLIRSGLHPFTPNILRLNMDFSTTGITNPKSIRELFKITCPHNPVFYTIFILMCCPWRWKIPNTIRVWGYAIVRAIRILRGK